MQVLLLICFAVLALASAPHAHTEEELQFVSWCQQHNKMYATTEEHDMRFNNFKASVARVALKNSIPNGATYALNKFSDLTPEEFRAKYLMNTPLTSVTQKTNLLTPKVEAEALPDTFDWRPKNIVTPVKDQEQCGSCWAFSVTENIESVWMLAKGLQVSGFKPLAPQQVVDCDTVDQGCNGGFPASAYNYIETAGGLDTEASYPYKGVGGTCAFNKDNVEAKISSFKYATTTGDETTLKQNLVAASPLSICVDAANWQDYTSGVMGAWECCWFCQLDHCVQLVGYDSTASTPFFIVRNSWGADWGENGYIRLAQGNNACLITDYATTSIVANSTN